MSDTSKMRLLFLLIIPVLLYVSSLKFMPLLDPDESRYSEISDSMIDTGDYVTPRLNHVVYLEKPPLAYWATAIAFKIFGENEFASRLFSGLCTWGCILLTFAMGLYLFDEKTGLYSAGVLSTFLYTYVLGHMEILDIPLTFFVCLSIWAGFRYLAGDKPKKGWLYLLYTASALAFLTKGLIGIIFPFAILVLWLIVTKKGWNIFKIFSPVGLFILIAIVSPWIILVQMANKDFLWFFFVHEHFLRYTTKIHDRSQPVLFYFPVVILGMMPWLAYLIQAIRAKRTVGYTMDLQKMNRRFIVTWIIFVFAFFSVSSSKLVPYIAPIFLPVAVILGHLFRKHDELAWTPLGKMADKLYYYLPVLLQSLLFIALLLFPLFTRNNTELGGDLMIIHSRNWIWLVLAPVVMQLLMIFLPGMIKRRFNSGWFLTTYLLSAVFLASLIFPVSAFLTPYKSSYPLAQAIKSNVPAGDNIYQYRIFLYGIASYTDIRTAAVDDFGEMRFGMEKLSPEEKSRYFLSQKEFFQLVRGKEKAVYCVTAKRKNLDELKKEFPRLEVIWSNNVYYLIRLPH